ncbi:MAG TPA: maleylacetoacetate isomerase [Polyangia bacterium]|nr:maleylacetoacetate isomerase [Polyangia bacterium]
MKLYTFWRSNSPWRVRIALAWKGVQHDVVTLDLGAGQQHTDDFRDLNLAEQVPVLELDELGPEGRQRRITQSMAIIEYLEERYPTPPLLPSEPWARARARQLAEIVNSGIQPFQNLATTKKVQALGVDPRAWLEHFISRGLAVLERAARETAGTFLVGEAVTIADVYLVPQLYAARRFGVDLAPYPTLARVDVTCAALPAFQTAHADAQPDAPAPVR